MLSLVRAIGLGSILVLAGCVETTESSAPVPAPSAQPVLSASQAARNFTTVVAQVEPVAEAECRRQIPNANCNFLIQLDRDPKQPPNAFQSLQKNGRPVITFTIALLREVHNADELAFIVGHEAAHHIEGHIPKQQQTAIAGATLAGMILSASGASEETIRQAQRFGAAVGGRVYAQDMELEADALGTRIAALAGYDPVRGAEYFARIPDPGQTFIGTHPPNAKRQQVVRQTAASL